MRLLTFGYGFLCDVAHVQSDGKASVLGIFDNINARQFPVVHRRMAVFVHWTGDEGKYTINLRLIGPDGGDVVPPIELGVGVPRGGTKANMIAELNQVELKRPGNYLFELSVEGQEGKAAISLPVNQVQ